MPDSLFAIALLVGLVGGGYIFYLARRKKRRLAMRIRRQKQPEK